MPSTKTIVQPGVCGFRAELRVNESDGTITATVDTTCPKVCSFIEKTLGCDAYTVAFTPQHENPVVKWAGESGLHACCPLPMAFIKAVEVSAGLALPSDISVHIEKE